MTSINIGSTNKGDVVTIQYKTGQCKVYKIDIGKRVTWLISGIIAKVWVNANIRVNFSLDPSLMNLYSQQIKSRLKDEYLLNESSHGLDITALLESNDDFE